MYKTYIVISFVAADINPAYQAFDISRLGIRKEQFKTCIKCEAQCDLKSITECKLASNQKSKVCRERLACCLGQNFHYTDRELCKYGCMTVWSEKPTGMRMVERRCSDLDRAGKEPRLQNGDF